MFQTRGSYHVYMALLAALIAASLFWSQRRFVARNKLIEISGRLVGTQLSDSGSGSLKLRTPGSGDTSYKYAWDINDKFSDIPKHEQITLLIDRDWIVALTVNGKISFDYDHYKFKRSRNQMVILVIAGIFLSVVTLAYVYDSIRGWDRLKLLNEFKHKTQDAG